MARKKEGKQQELHLPTWGGRRKGAGRNPKGKKAGVRHAEREKLPRSCPAHITMKVAPDVWNLRGSRIRPEIRAIFWQMRGIARMRLTQFSIQRNHLHLIVEADGHESLSMGMRVLATRLAARINRVMSRRGRVFPDRFHMHILRSPREVEHAIRYVRDNSRIHARREGKPWGLTVDPCTGGPCRTSFPAENRCLVLEPRTWLLRRAWGLPPSEAPRPVPPPVSLCFPWMGEGEDTAPRNLELALDAA